MYKTRTRNTSASLKGSDATVKGFPKGNCSPPFRKEASILRTETFGSHSLSGSPKEIDTFIIERGVTSSSRGRSRDVLPVGKQELDASVVPRKAVNAALNEDETELRILSLRFLSRCFRIDLAFFTRKYRTSRMDGARPSFLRIRRNLMPVNNFTCGTPKPSLNVTSTTRASYFSPPTCQPAP